MNQVDPAGDVEWNFEKFLIDRKGEAISRFKSSVEPDSIEIQHAIEDFKLEAEKAERQGDYGKVAELRYGKIKEAQEKKNATSN